MLFTLQGPQVHIFKLLSLIMKMRHLKLKKGSSGRWGAIGAQSCLGVIWDLT